MIPFAKSTLLSATAAAALTGAVVPAQAQVQRVLGLDVSAWQGSLPTTSWATFKRPVDQQAGGVYGDGRDFVIIRSSRGGTTGYYDQSDPDNSNGLNTLSQRYDDPYFVQNITRATNAGLFAGSYHFARADIIASTLNSGGIANTGTDEANHMIQMAGAWMRPGYLLPVLDLEAGATQRSTTELSAFAVAFSDRIYQQMGIRPMIYVNSSYANSEVNSTVPASMPNLWIARPSSADPFTTEPPPAVGYPNVYGVWNPLYPVIPAPPPWKFWQYNTGAGLNGYSGNIDKNAANGGMEFLKDYLVPALWMNDASDLWTTGTNWNSGQTPAAPVQGPGQVARVGSLTLPAPRLPGSNDTVILDRPNASITVTLASGTHTIRKLYVRETLHITGGSLTAGYIPSPDSTAITAQFSGPVTLSGSGILSVHSLQVDAAQMLTLGGGTLIFDTINLMPHSTTPARIAVTGDVSFGGLSGSPATIVSGVGSGSAGLVDLGGGARSFNVADGLAEVDLVIAVPIANGALTKAGPGTMSLSNSHSYTGGTTVQDGLLDLSGSLNSGVTVAGGILALGNATGIRTVNGSLAVNAGGTLRVRINGTAAGAQYDQLRLTSASAVAALSGALDVVAAPGLAAGTTFLILDISPGNGAVTGNFFGKPAGSVFAASGFNWIISYSGGDGNDVTLTVAKPQQSWRYAYFGTTASTGNAADFADMDNDGIVNLTEYALGGIPTSAAQTPLPQLSAPGSKLALTFTRTVSNNDITITVQGADNPSGPWTDLAASTNGTGMAPLLAGVTATETGSGPTRRVEVRDRYLISDPGHPRRFMRVEVKKL